MNGVKLPTKNISGKLDTRSWDSNVL